MVMLSSKEKDQIKRIQELLVADLKDSTQEDFFISFKQLENELLLKNRTGFEKILDLIKENSNNKITWKLKKEVFSLKGGASALEGVTTPSRAIEKEVGVHIHISDNTQIRNYFKLILDNKADQDLKHKIHSEDNSEEIVLKSYGVRIKGNMIIRNKKSTKVFNPTEKKLIYLLYYKHLNNPDECIALETLRGQLGRNGTYIKNSITSIHRIIAKTISNHKPMKILFIKNEPTRGYHLNPRLLI